MKLFLRICSVLLGLAIFLVIGFFITLSIINSPGYAWRVMTLFTSDTNDYKVFPSRAVENAAQVSVLPAAPGLLPESIKYRYQDQDRSENLEELLKRSKTSAFLVIQDDQLVVERYLESTREDIHTSFSVAKSFNSALIGAAIEDGFIALDDRVIQYVPEIAGRGLDELTILNLLRMDTGIRYRSENERLAPFSDDALTYYPPDLRKVALSVQAGKTPVGEAFHYNNFHPLLEGIILERATGMTVAEYLQEKIWKPMGAEFPASWSLDSDSSGFEKMESGINARAIDFARFGMIFLHNGFWNGQQILPAEWVAASTQPDPNDQRIFEDFEFWPQVGGYYSYHWWGLQNEDGTYDFMAQGHLGQIIYVAPRKNIVVVRLGDEPDANINWAFVIQALVDQM